MKDIKFEGLTLPNHHSNTFLACSNSISPFLNISSTFPLHAIQRFNLKFFVFSATLLEIHKYIFVLGVRITSCYPTHELSVLQPDFTSKVQRAHLLHIPPPICAPNVPRNSLNTGCRSSWEERPTQQDGQANWLLLGLLRLQYPHLRKNFKKARGSIQVGDRHQQAFSVYQ